MIRFSRPVSRPSTVASCAASPIRRRTAFGSCATSMPDTLARPESASVSVVSTRTAVVLPAPLGPSRPHTVPRGTVCGLLGPNGAGKTTAVRVLTTLTDADSGRASVSGIDVAQDPKAVRRLIGLAAQDATVDGLLTGRENLIMIGELHHLGRRTSQARADELLEQFDLVEAGGRRAKTYSGGMRRRLDLAATLVARPEVLFLDEPTTGLDPRARNELWDVLETLVDEGATILLTTQYLEEADRLADDIVVVDRGRVIA